MEKRYFKCTFLSDIVLNARTATEGKSMSMEYVPGSTFLGIVAKKYTEFGEKAFEVFHSGRVRFSDAHPCTGNQRSLKIPYGWFYEKLSTPIEKNKVDPAKIFVYHKMTEEIKKRISEKDQLKQMRECFFLENGLVCNVEHSFAIKSAHDLDKRRANDGQMYGYDALRKGTEWIFYLECDDPCLTESVVERIVGRHRIGRSRSCQYGQVKIQEIFEVPEFKVCDRIEGSRITLYAESCLAFLDEYGQPSFCPEPKDFNLPEGSKILEEFSQIRTKVFAPWNRTLKTRDRDRVCIDKGSVFVVQVPSVFDLKAFRESVKSGVGLYRSEGMGKIWVNPRFLEALENAHPEIEVVQETHSPSQMLYSIVDSDDSDGSILAWTGHQKKREEKNRELMRAVNDFMREHGERYKNISASQWGAIREKAMGSSDYSGMMNSLFQPDTGFLMHGKSEKDWKDRRESLKSRIEDVQQKIGEEYARIFAVKLCSEMAKHVSQKKGEKR